MSTYQITGATSGLGADVAMGLARAGHSLVLPNRSPAKASALRIRLQQAGASRVEAPMLDLKSLQSVAAFLRVFTTQGTGLDGVLLNAGSQPAKGLRFTAEGFESTFVVNHLAHYQLLAGLMPMLAPGARVGWTSSGTHDPDERVARLFGFRGGRYESASKLAKGEYEPYTSIAQVCRDAYATAKMCEVVSARLFAERHAARARFFSFDPGLMPGTGLAREHNAAGRWVWNNLLPYLAFMIPGASTTSRSAAVLVDLLSAKYAFTNGAYLRYTGKQQEPATIARDRWVMDDLAHTSEVLIAPFA